MVERVADALRRKVGPCIDQQVAEMAARIAIEAMREPTEAMQRCGAKEWDEDCTTETNAFDMFNAMIDEALK